MDSLTYSISDIFNTVHTILLAYHIGIMTPVYRTRRIEPDRVIVSLGRFLIKKNVVSELDFKISTIVRPRQN